jgi:hypothetical protein
MFGGTVKNDQLQKISDEADLIQLAVEILFLNPRFGPKPQLRFFLQNRLDKADFETLKSLTLQGQTRFLAKRFLNYLAGEPRQPD